MTTPTLLVLAAGMGSRYGGLKQIDPVGPGGEAILDYSVFDALRAGFGKVIFVIRQSMADAFQQAVGSRFEKRLPVEFVFQELDKLPPGFTPPPGRQKPWGTAHAVLMAAAGRTTDQDGHIRDDAQKKPGLQAVMINRFCIWFRAVHTRLILEWETYCDRRQ